MEEVKETYHGAQKKNDLSVHFARTFLDFEKHSAPHDFFKFSKVYNNNISRISFKVFKEENIYESVLKNCHK